MRAGEPRGPTGVGFIAHPSAPQWVQCRVQSALDLDLLGTPKCVRAGLGPVQKKQVAV
jgi:hypothetical protein